MGYLSHRVQPLLTSLDTLEEKVADLTRRGAAFGVTDGPMPGTKVIHVSTPIPPDPTDSLTETRPGIPLQLITKEYDPAKATMPDLPLAPPYHPEPSEHPPA